MIQDECPEINRANFLYFIGQLEPLVRVFLTSRPNVDLQAQFASAIRIDISASDSDIKAYLEHKINRNNRISVFTGKDTKLKEDIIQNLSQKADGM